MELSWWPTTPSLLIRFVSRPCVSDGTIRSLGIQCFLWYSVVGSSYLAVLWIGGSSFLLWRLVHLLWKTASYLNLELCSMEFYGSMLVTSLYFDLLFCWKKGKTRDALCTYPCLFVSVEDMLSNNSLWQQLISYYVTHLCYLWRRVVIVSLGYFGVIHSYLETCDALPYLLFSLLFPPLVLRLPFLAWDGRWPLTGFIGCDCLLGSWFSQYLVQTYAAFHVIVEYTSLRFLSAVRGTVL